MYFVVSSKTRCSLAVNSGIFPSSMLKLSELMIFLIFGTIFFRRAADAPDFTMPSSSRERMTPSLSSRTMFLRHLAMLGLRLRTSITAPKSYSTKEPSARTPMFPA
ncbi:hypothetical protein MT325_m405L [Paramecium bursaria chlorella virus MT325]|uniref:Uncharacterized protein m405L n=1 Tax=Paramecium bursaria Chlorella virus MT325 TaxID=346932 RepID=A7IUD5_PBCVM|nr:hypothetical protein MT325_m405L [Paramecium bursaria chlorella virus MT325]